MIEGVPGGAWGACEVVDISVLGAGLELFKVGPLPLVGCQILVEVHTPAGASINVQMLGEIRYSIEGVHGGTRVGIEFANLSETEQRILQVLEHMRAVW
jgi:hypothetical protein